MRPIDRQLIIAGSVVLVYLVFGTWFFAWQEHWRTFDAFYFSAMTLTTVGYGDFTPHTDASKLVAIFFAFSGISIIYYSLSIFAREYFEHQEQRFAKLTRIPTKLLSHAGLRRDKLAVLKRTELPSQIIVPVRVSTAALQNLKVPSHVLRKRPILSLKKRRR